MFFWRIRLLVTLLWVIVPLCSIAAGATPADEPPAKRVRREEPSVVATSTGTGQRLPKRGDSMYETFSQILQTKPHPVAVPLINVEREQREGSRRFVKRFPGDYGEDPKKWHTESLEHIKAFRNLMTTGHNAVAAAETNVALARISFFSNKDALIREVVEIPYFFVSGLPANKDLNAFQKFSGEFSSKIQGKPSSYGIRFITMQYKDGEKKHIAARDYGAFFNKIHIVIKNEHAKEGEEKMLQVPRTGPHIKLTSPSEDYPIQAQLYFHSEQAMRQAIKEEIDRVRQCNPFRPPAYAIVDICSWYDMCWCCGDVLSSCSHIEDFGLQVFFHQSGENAYFDRPFNEMGARSLRAERTQFEGYMTNAAYTKNPYKPYIAHLSSDDLRSS